MSDEPILDKYMSQTENIICNVYYEGFEGAIDKVISLVDEVFKENGYISPKVLKDKLLYLKENG